jgi:hypothetical protein
VFAPVALAACLSCGAPASTAPVPRRDNYTVWIQKRVGQKTPEECLIRPLVPEETVLIHPFQARANIPATYVYAFHTLPTVWMTFLGGRPGERAELWRPGIGLPWAERWLGGGSEDLVLQFGSGRTYIPLALSDGWLMSSAFECWTAVGSWTARVLVFTLDHPVEGRIHGLAGFTPSPQFTGRALSILGLGESEASLAEFLGILKSVR